MNSDLGSFEECPPLPMQERIIAICDRFENGWKAGQSPQIDDHLSDCTASEQTFLLRELLALDVHYRIRNGQSPCREEYLVRYPQYGELIQEVFEEDGPDGARFQKTATIKPSADTSAHVTSGEDSADHPEYIGRYRIEQILGRGGFGMVYLAHDDALQRPVAIKVPFADRVSTPEDVEFYLSEARVVAGLDHPSIVPVYDVGRTDNGLCYVVSRYIEGHDLGSTGADERLSIGESAELVAIVAEALHYAHCRRIVHRDIKPANIRIATDGRPYLLDFGIALAENDFGNDVGLAGTPAYMSPEQARGESHLVDGRSDIFSLGTVLYELLTGVQPFQASDWLDVVDRVTTADVRPPRQLDDTLPKEVERICLKALSSRASDRYTTALDMAEDLRHFRAELEAGEVRSNSAVKTEEPLASESSKIVPKGLRAFDASDADFFLELMPGPRDRDGLPENVRFWKSRIEETDSDETFRVGLIYGPSGCGKSSLVKAGLLPRLADHVRPVYVEATAGETESRLLGGLRKRCPDLSSDLNLIDALVAIRHGDRTKPGQKVLIVLDQFEQWLHAKQQEAVSTELVRALRQCDGQHVQCVVMVRDDFWMAATRFFHDLDVRLFDGENSAAVDLFDVLHARTVLSKFGCAFGRLPGCLSQVSTDQGAFLDQAISGLARDGKIVCVRLSVFAEMVKGKRWTPATLKAVGGTEGVGVAFLEETFSATTAPPEHRLHQKAVRGILKVLLPESGIDIKGSTRSRGELLDASGYAERPSEFGQLIDILDSRIRLITPTDPSGMVAEDCDVAASNRQNLQSSKKHYQLTHDYLVPSLRSWLTKKQKETRRGRAELRLAERSAAWTAKPEKRNLPTWWEFVDIRLFTEQKSWTAPQREFMRQATRSRLKQGAFWLVLLVGIVSASVAVSARLEARRKSDHAQSLVQRLIDADITNAREIISELHGYRKWSDPLLEIENRAAPEDSARRLHTALALLPNHDQVEYLEKQMLLLPSREFMVVRDALGIEAGRRVDLLWELTLDDRRDPQQRFQAACALAEYSPADLRWKQIGQFVADHLVSVLPSHLAEWAKALHPAKEQLVAPLLAIFQDMSRSDQQRLFAVVVLSDYSNDVGFLFDLLKDANERQFDVVLEALKPFGKRALDRARTIVSSSTAVDDDANEKERNARMRALAAVVTLRMGEPAIDWSLVSPLLRHVPEPLVRSNLVNWIDLPSGHAPIIANRLDRERDSSIRRGLVLALKNVDVAGLSSENRRVLFGQLLRMYREEPDPGLHGSLDWVLRQRGMAAEVEEIDHQMATGKVEGNRQWYVNRESQTMIVITGPQDFTMGSPPTEERRTKAEVLHTRRIRRSFSIASKEVSVDQFHRFLKANRLVHHSYHEEDSPTPNCPQTSVTWFEAAQFCNWLSQQDRIPEDQWCYLPDKKSGHFPGEGDRSLAEELELAPGYLSLSGYRLPTEAEWECACRAGTTTKRSYGNSDELLSAYAWYGRNSQMHARPVGLLKPNGFGLFDMQGNVYEWCQNGGQEQPVKIEGGLAEDVEHVDRIVTPRISRAKGGSFVDLAMDVRPALRGGQYPAVRTRTVGFRPARTVQP